MKPYYLQISLLVCMFISRQGTFDYQLQFLRFRFGVEAGDHIDEVNTLEVMLQPVPNVPLQHMGKVALCTYGDIHIFQLLRFGFEECLYI